MSKTLIDLDRDLVGRATAALGGVSMKEAVHEGLRRIVREAAAEQLSRYFAELDPEQEKALANAKQAW